MSADGCHCLYLSPIPKKLLLFYIENLKEEDVYHPHIDLLNDFYSKTINGKAIYSNYFEIEDPLILLLISMMEQNCTFQSIIDRMNELSSQFYGTKSPKIKKNKQVDIYDIARRYWKPSPLKITKNHNDENIVFRSRRSSNSLTPSPKLISNF